MNKVSNKEQLIILMDGLMVIRGLIRSYGDIGILDMIGLVFRERILNKVFDKCEIS